MKIDYSKFNGNLPYSSELYGIYQPLLGWKSQQIGKRLASGIEKMRSNYLATVIPRFTPQYNYNNAGDPREARFAVMLATPNNTPAGTINPALDSIVARRVSALVQQAGPDDPNVWHEFTTPDQLLKILNESHDQILQEYTPTFEAQTREGSTVDPRTALAGILRRESTAAGVLGFLNQQSDNSALPGLVMSSRKELTLAPIILFLQLLDPAQSDLARAVISPIGIVHLFRQYFFEFDSFLGPSVQHLWLSPGGTVELVEVSTRKTLIERTTEQAIESMDKSEKSTTTQDEISDAIREENSSSTKVGVSATASVSYTPAFVSASGSVTGSFNLENNQKQAREQTHKSLRQQTEKVSSEIRKSFKTTFRMVTETTDVTSRRHVIQNTTDRLINYELRRKMRQVGIQVQDYGTQLCWQAYIDQPGDELGVAELVHIAQPADLQNLKEPDKPPQPEPEIAAPALTLTGSWPDDDDDTHYGFMPFIARLQVVPPKPGYVYSRSEVVVVDGPHWWFRARPETTLDTTIDFETGPLTLGPPDIENIDMGSGSTEPSVKTIWVGAQTAPSGLSDDEGHNFSLKVTLFFRPSQKLIKDINDEYNTRMKDYSDAKSLVLQQALFTEARDRVKSASNIQPRRVEDLREEERTVVYRSLIRQLLAVAGIKDEDHRVRHLFAELVESMFDIDRMLYFVAPEWWMPRFKPLDKHPPLGHKSPQDVGLGDKQDTFGSQEVVSWGGAKGNRPDNYYITEDSTPAKVGSSLGWLLQLDGDNLRNAFLNAPWVKAVIPIRAGREWNALGWLSSDQIEGSDGLDALYEARDAAERQMMVEALKGNSWDDPNLTARYAGLDPNQITILDAIRYLIVRIQARHQADSTSVPDPLDPTLGYLPSDKVFEHGFDPLQGGFRADPKDSVKNAFEVFDQWIEIMPTDQIVPVEVQYDPKTGMQI